MVVITQMSCATQNSSPSSDMGFKDLIKKNLPVYIENQTIEEAIDFTSFVDSHLISNGVYQVNINSNITFKKCVFKKPVHAFRKMDNGDIVITSFKGNLTFIDCIFKEDVNFRASSIQGRTDFSNSSFNVSANFEELSCQENAFFNLTKFEGDLRFQNSFFNRNANFMNIECFGNTSFQNSVFNSELQFSAGRFYNYVDFTLIDCRDRALFNYVEFKGKADFSSCIFLQDFDFVSTKNTTTNFDNSRFLGKVRFNKSEVLTSLSLKGTYFLLDAPEIDIPAEKLINSK